MSEYKEYPPTEQQKLNAIVGIEDKLGEIDKSLKAITLILNSILLVMNKPSLEECEREVAGWLAKFQMKGTQNEDK